MFTEYSMKFRKKENRNSSTTRFLVTKKLLDIWFIGIFFIFRDAL